MTTDIAIREDVSNPATAEPQSRLVSTAMHMGQVYKLAEAISGTQFCPKPFQGKPADLAAAMMYGDELGLAPMAATRAVYVVNGTPGLYAKYMVAVVQAAGHEVWTVEDTPAKVTVAGKRRGSSHVEQVTWTTERARKAGYTSNKKYDTDPQAMLYARAAGDVARRVAMDALGGLSFTVEELELGTPADTVTVSRQTTEKRTAQRRKPEPVAEAEPEFDESPTEADTTPAPTEPELPMITSQQTKLLAVLMKEADLTDRSAALAYAGSVIGREISSRNELTADEATRVIDQLKADAAALEPITDDQGETA